MNLNETNSHHIAFDDKIKHLFQEVEESFKSKPCDISYQLILMPKLLV